MKHCAANLNICIHSLLYFVWLLNNLEGAEFRLIVLQDKFVDQCAVEDFGMLLADALIVYDEVAFLTASEDYHFFSWDAYDFQIFAFRHAKHLQDQIGHFFRPIDFENFILLAVQINLIWVLGVAEFARADLINGRRAVFEAVVRAAAPQPLLQAL